MKFNKLSDFITAMGIFLLYGDKETPFFCVDEEFQVHGYHPNNITDEHKRVLDDLGFFFNDEDGCWTSFRWGN